MSDLFGIGVSGLRSAQESLAVTGQNITNANTKGYVRQRVVSEAQVLAGGGGTFRGSGTRTTEVQRIADQFVISQVRADTARASDFSAFADRLSQVEGLFFSQDAGIDEAMNRFFEAVHGANANPGSLPARQIVLNTASGLVDRINAVHARLKEQFGSTDLLLHNSIDRVNDIAANIADINYRLGEVSANPASGEANGLLDQRDELLRELSEHVQVSVVDSGQQQINIFVGAGQPLVNGQSASRMLLREDGQLQLQVLPNSPPLNISQTVQGGDIGGLVRYRDGAVVDLMNDLGVLAGAIVQAVNETHVRGLDLNGEFGELFFDDFNAPELTYLRSTASLDNTGSGVVSVRIDDAREMVASDYELQFSTEQPGAYLIRRIDDGEVVSQGALGQLPHKLQFDGVEVTFESGDFDPGDRFLLAPARSLAGDMRVSLTDPTRLALASPVRIDASENNAGNARLTIQSIDDIDNPVFSPEKLSPPLKVVFTSPTTYDILDNSDPLNPKQLDPPLRSLVYTAAAGDSLLPEDGSTLVTMTHAVAGRLPADYQVVGNTQGVDNGYPAGKAVLTIRDPVTGGLRDTRTIPWNANASAREIAHALRSGGGIEARAVTEVFIEDLDNNPVTDTFEIVINGRSFKDIQDLNALADAINGDGLLQSAGIRAKSDGERLTLTDIHGDDVNIHVGGDPADGITVIDHQGGALRVNGAGAGNFKTVTVGGVVTTELLPGQRLTGDGGGLFATAPEHATASFGFSLGVSGVPRSGDSFVLTFNSDATADNRNGIALAELALAQTTGDPAVTFNEAFAFLVQNVGNLQREANVQKEAAGVLLDQSVATQDSISGVNLDEEAANLIKFEQAYNASARIISVARDIFNVLFDAVR